MRIDPHKEARRLLGGTSHETRTRLAADPATTVTAEYGVIVEPHPAEPSDGGCAVDGIYTAGPPPLIRFATDTSPARQRFTILHELGHHLIEHDTRLNDLMISDEDRRDEEICNEVAATVLIPDDTIDSTLGSGTPTAKRVAQLFNATNASRAACCVAAARRLYRPGCVILGTADGQAVFIAHDPATFWRIGRGTQQGADSLLARAAARRGGHARGETRVMFATGRTSGRLHGDAFTADRRWVFAVIVDDSHSPWKKGLNLGIPERRPEGEEIECTICETASVVFTAPCRECGDRTCPTCGQCSCRLGPRPRQCIGCFLEKTPLEFPGASANLCSECVEHHV